jgi:hypothetical protein
MKFTETVVAAEMVKVQVSPLEHASPVHPPNVLPNCGLAERHPSRLRKRDRAVITRYDAVERALRCPVRS